MLEIARHKIVSAAKRAGIALKQTFAKEGKTLRRKAGGYAHAKQFRRLKKTVKRQRTVLGVVMREVQRKLDADTQAIAAGGAPAVSVRARHLELTRPAPDHRVHDERGGDDLQGSDAATRSLHVG